MNAIAALAYMKNLSILLSPSLGSLLDLKLEKLSIEDREGLRNANSSSVEAFQQIPRLIRRTQQIGFRIQQGV